MTEARRAVTAELSGTNEHCLIWQTGRKRVANELISAFTKVNVKEKMSRRRDDPLKLEELVACQSSGPSKNPSSTSKPHTAESTC